MNQPDSRRYKTIEFLAFACFGYFAVKEGLVLNNGRGTLWTWLFLVLNAALAAWWLFRLVTGGKRDA